MAVIATVQYVTQKCNSCGGTKLNYDPVKKMWECLYCGNLIERQEKADSLFTIKNVVRQTLQDIAYVRLTGAQDNLVECEKIDSRYVGTIIASMTYEMNMLSYSELSQGEQRNLIAQMKKHYTQLRDLGDRPTEEELVLYDFLDSAEAIGVLILAYDRLKLTERRDYLLPLFDATQVYSPDLNTALIRFAMGAEKYDLFDKLIQNTESIDSHDVTATVLSEYPDGDQKRQNLEHLIENGSWSEDDKGLFAAYFNETEDAMETVLTVATAIAALPCRPNIDCVMSRVIARLTSAQQVTSLLDAMTVHPLLDVEVYTILSYGLDKCTDEVCLSILKRFHETEQFVELDHNHFITMLSRQSPASVKKAMVEAGRKFHVKPGAAERFVSAYLCEIDDLPATRKEVLSYLLGLVPSLPTKSVESYLLCKDKDGAHKEAVVRQLFSMDINRSFFRETLGNYILRSGDEPTVKNRIVAVLIELGLPITQAGCVHILQGTLSSVEKVELLSRMRAAGLRYDDVAGEYIATCDRAQFDHAVWSELMSGVNAVSESTIIRYVLVMAVPPQAKARELAGMIGRCYNPPTSIGCSVIHGGNTVVCNVAQAYLLVAPEQSGDAAQVMQVLAQGGTDLNGEVTVNGQRMKFKKYIASQKRTLSALTAEMCTRYRLL